MEFEIGRMLLRCIFFNEQWNNFSTRVTGDDFLCGLEVFQWNSNGALEGRFEIWDEEMKMFLSPLTKAHSFRLNDDFYTDVPFINSWLMLVKRRCVIWRWFKSLWKDWLDKTCNGLPTLLPSFATLLELQVRCFKIRGSDVLPRTVMVDI